MASTSTPIDGNGTTSLHILLVSNWPLGTIQTSTSVKSTERVSPNIALFQLTPGNATFLSANSTQSDIVWRIQDRDLNSTYDNSSVSSSMLQLSELLIWYPLSAIGGGAPQLYNDSPSGSDLLVYSAKTTDKETSSFRRRGRGGCGCRIDQGKRYGSRRIAARQSIAVEGTPADATTNTPAGAEIVVPFYSVGERRRRVRMGYYVVAPGYPRETIAKLLGSGGSDGRLSPFWFSQDFASSSEELSSSGSEEEDVEMEEAGDERSCSFGDSSIRGPPTTRKSAWKAWAERLRQRGIKRVAPVENEDEFASVDTDDDDYDDGNEYGDEDDGNTKQKARGPNTAAAAAAAQLGQGPAMMALPWAAALAGGIRLRGEVDIIPLGQPPHK
ncbi:hypothetical protein PG987_014357 [Apiospora arundinis]|uniref:Uncharacterized protein n=1 Tax=Apiospora arundinis TaxID=335852 RepID=A0ABR2HLJ2_9PEZI